MRELQRFSGAALSTPREHPNDVGLETERASRKLRVVARDGLKRALPATRIELQLGGAQQLELGGE